ncbi:MAG: helix-turn-helix transcriptional regulator, partial [Phenylobacterium sp.]|nr:helix-turn-helix transcriptional regulator [Phenylobacterium sp.]
AADSPEAGRQLERLIGAAAGLDGQRVGGALRVPLPETRTPLSVQVSPVGVTRHPVLGGRHMAMVCVNDLEAELAAPADALRELFDLTPAEVRLAAAVFEGLTLAEAAGRFGVSANTVRFQLARIFDKTGVSRQAELVKLMMRLADGPGC